MLTKTKKKKSLKFKNQFLKTEKMVWRYGGWLTFHKFGINLVLLDGF